MPVPVHVNGGKAGILAEDHFGLMAVIDVEPLPTVVSADDLVAGDEGKKQNGREIVLGRNVHTESLEVTEPDANDEFTGDKEAYMAGVLARYRKTLVERTKHHLGNWYASF